jgi:catechol 2,3-dioxygenase-like lactoylglutathione lyase family enzyme
MSVNGFDHVAIPTARPEEMLRFYHALGFAVPSPEEWVAGGVPFFSIQFGDNKINVHAPALWGNAAFTLRGVTAQPGCGDFCFVWSGSLEGLSRMLRDAGAPIEEGPVERVGGRDAGRAKGTSIYTRDPDRNLLEFIVYDPAAQLAAQDPPA